MKTALVLLQLGDWGDGSKFVKAMLSDKRVKKQTLFWKVVLHCCILPKYKRANKSPIVSYTEELRQKLQVKLPELEVHYALNYLNIEEVLDSLVGRVEKIILQPLFPQYSSAVVGSVLERALVHLSKMVFIPQIIVAAPFFDNPDYIEALCHKVKQKPEALILSYHSIPVGGDPYQAQTEATTAAIKKVIGDDLIIKHAYQSRFGRGGQWLAPSVVETVLELRSAGIERLAVLAAGFLMDCSETLIEIDKDLRELFYKLGGKDFQYITCFNADDALVDIIVKSVKRYL